MHFLSTFHPLHLSCLLCQLTLFQYSLFLSFHHFYCFSVVPFSFHLPSPFLSFCLPLILFPHPLHCIISFACASSPLHFEPAHTFLSFPSFVFCFHPPPHPPFPFWMYCPGRGSWCLSPGILGCCRGLQRPRQDLRAVCHYCVQTQPGRQWRLLEDLSPVLRLPRLPYEDHWTGVCVSSDVFIAAFQMSTPSLSWKEHNISVKTWSSKSWTAVSPDVLVWESGVDPQAARKKDLQQHGQRLLGEEKKRPQCLPTGNSFTCQCWLVKFWMALLPCIILWSVYQ